MKRWLIGMLAGLVAMSATGLHGAPLPTRVLTCSATRITKIETRLEGSPDSGSMVVFANGGTQVSYSRVPPIEASRIGDHAFVCLVYVPRHCPRGDVRGKIYTTTNLRSLDSWTLPDSEHSCGGA